MVVRVWAARLVDVEMVLDETFRLRPRAITGCRKNPNYLRTALPRGSIYRMMRPQSRHTERTAKAKVYHIEVHRPFRLGFCKGFGACRRQRMTVKGDVYARFKRLLG